MTFVEVLPKDENGQIIFSPGAKNNVTGEYEDGKVNPEWLKNAFPNIANDEMPFSKEHYDFLNNADIFWKVNMINWRKNGVLEVEGIEDGEIIQEEEDFLLEMFPPAPEPEPEPEEEQQPEEETDEPTEEEPTNEPTEEPAPEEEAAPQTEEETTEEA